MKSELLALFSALSVATACDCPDCPPGKCELRDGRSVPCQSSTDALGDSTIASVPAPDVEVPKNCSKKVADIMGYTSEALKHSNPTKFSDSFDCPKAVTYITAANEAVEDGFECLNPDDEDATRNLVTQVFEGVKLVCDL